MERTRPLLLAALATLLAGCQTLGLGGGPDERVIGAAAGNGAWPAIATARRAAPGYTIYRPQLLPLEPLPIVLWGNGGCRDNGLSASHFLREIASHGYLVIANGAPGEERAPLAALPTPPAAASGRPAAPPPPPRERTPDETSVEQYLGAIALAEAMNRDGDDPLAGRVDATRVAALGHSCGGLQALAAATGDPRVDAVMAFASGVYNRPNDGLSGVHIRKEDLARLRTPVAYVIGGEGDIAYPNARDDFERIGHVPVMLANLPVGHGGTFALANGGDWARVAVDWLDWQLKGEEAAGRSFVGAGCRLCTAYGWSVERRNFPERP